LDSNRSWVQTPVWSFVYSSYVVGLIYWADTGGLCPFSKVTGSKSQRGASWVGLASVLVGLVSRLDMLLMHLIGSVYLLHDKSKWTESRGHQIW